MPELEEVKTRLNLSRPFEELPTKSHYSHAQRDAGSVQVVCTPSFLFSVLSCGHTAIQTVTVQATPL